MFSLFTADFGLAARLQLEFKVAAARYYIRADAVVPALGALRGGRCFD